MFCLKVFNTWRGKMRADWRARSLLAVLSGNNLGINEGLLSQSADRL